VVVSAIGQITPLADQYLINPFLTNPALAGTSRYSPVSLSARRQWVGMPSAPVYEALTFHKSLLDKRKRFNPRGFLNRGDNSFGKVGVGGGVFNLQYGSIRQIGIHLDYAYHVYLDKGRLSFGLAPMYHQFIIDKSGFIPPDGTDPDPLLDNSGKEVIHFLDVNAGVHYYSDRFFAGLSVVQLLNSSVFFGDLSFVSTEDLWQNPWLSRSLYAYGGVTVALGDEVFLEPSVLAKYSERSGLDAQLNTTVTILENFQAGAYWRYDEAVGMIAGIRTGNLVFRYQGEIPIGNGGYLRLVTHQIMVGYLLD